MAKVNKKKSILLFFAFIVFVIYMGYHFVTLQVSIHGQNELYAQKQEEINQKKTEIDELNYVLKNGGEAAYLEKLARDMGYVNPDERVFVDISK